MKAVHLPQKKSLQNQPASALFSNKERFGASYCSLHLTAVWVADN